MDKDLIILYAALFSILLVVVGYFLNKQINVIESLNKAVIALDKTVALLQQNQSNFSKLYEDNQTAIQSRFQSHSQKLHEHSTDIVEIKSSIQNIKEIIK